MYSGMTVEVKPTYIGTKIIRAIPFEKDSKDGYEVTYEDGYVSWSPKDVFEKAYRLTTGMPFGLAIEAMKMGKKVARAGWNGKGMYCEVQYPRSTSKMDRPYIYMTPVDGRLVPWLASQTDMLADDWYLV